MRRYKIAFLASIAIAVIFISTLIGVRNITAAEPAKMEGIEDVAQSFEDFKIPAVDAEIKEKYIFPLVEAFDQKKNAYMLIKKVIEKVEKSFTDENVDLSSI